MTTFYFSETGKMLYSVDEIKVRGTASSGYSLIFYIREFSDEYSTALNKMIKVKNFGEGFQYCVLTLYKFDVEKYLNKIKSHLIKMSYFYK